MNACWLEASTRLNFAIHGVFLLPRFVDNKDFTSFELETESAEEFDEYYSFVMASEIVVGIDFGTT